MKFQRVVTLVSAVLYFSAMTATTAVAQDRAASPIQPKTVLVRNVKLINQEGIAEDVIVNILIRDKKLDVVTKDEIPADTVELALDAQQGILLGKLNLGHHRVF